MAFITPEEIALLSQVDATLRICRDVASRLLLEWNKRDALALDLHSNESCRRWEWLRDFDSCVEDISWAYRRTRDLLGFEGFDCLRQSQKTKENT